MKTAITNLAEASADRSGRTRSLPSSPTRDKARPSRRPAPNGSPPRRLQRWRRQTASPPPILNFKGAAVSRHRDCLRNLRECRTHGRRKLQYHSGSRPEHWFAADHRSRQAGPHLCKHQPRPASAVDSQIRPDITQYTISNPTTSDFKQYNGRLDADVTSKDHASFAIYWVPSSTTTLNGGLGYQLFNHSQINDAFSVIWNHIFSPTFLNEARANAAGWRYNEVESNPQAPFGLPQDQFSSNGTADWQYHPRHPRRAGAYSSGPMDLRLQGRCHQGSALANDEIRL